MTPPPTGWPRIVAADWLIWSFEFAVDDGSSRSRTVGRWDWSATSKKTVKTPLMNPTEIELPDRQAPPSR